MTKALTSSIDELPGERAATLELEVSRLQQLLAEMLIENQRLRTLCHRAGVDTSS